METIRFDVLPDKDVDEARRMRRVVPHLVAQRAGLVVGQYATIVDRRVAAIERLRTDLVSRQFMALAWIALDWSHTSQSRPST